jgi:hypothetical protein
MITCLCCTPGVPLKRCTNDYKKFKRQIKKRIPQIISSSGGQMVEVPELEALLNMDFDALVAGKPDVYAQKYLVKIGDGEWQWVGRCPTCYDFEVPEVQDQMKEGFVDLEPKILSREIIDYEARELEMPSGLIAASRVPVRLDAIELETLLSYEEEKAVRFFACDPPTHNNYLNFWRPPPASADRRKLWRLLYTGRDGEWRALSLCCFDVLRGRWQREDELAQGFLECVRSAAPFHRAGKSKETLLKHPVDSSIRVNRISGPFGHMRPGATFHDHRLAACDQRVTGATPRRWTATVAVGIRTAGGAITGISVFYVGVKGGKRAAIAVPRHHGMPRRGFVASGHHLSDSLRQHARAADLLEMARWFTKTTYDGALLLLDLYTARPDLPFASQVAVERTMKNYELHLSHFNGGAPTSSRTRSQTVAPFTRGDYVFAHYGTADDELWWPATIVMARRDGTCSLRYDDSDEDDPTMHCKPVERIRPDVAGAGTTDNAGVSSLTLTDGSLTSRVQPDGEEDHDPSAALIAELMASRGVAFRAQPAGAQLAPHQIFTFLDVLLDAGEYTALLEVIFGHEDNFGADTGALLENKLLLPWGPRHTARKLSDLPEVGPVPHGGLGIPRCKVSTVIGAMQDVELHELHGIFHAGRSVRDGAGGATETAAGRSVSKAARKRRRQRDEESCMKRCMISRSCWKRSEDGKCGSWYEHGVGVADWDSRAYY